MNTCQSFALAIETEPSEALMDAAYSLACLLTDQDVFQDSLRQGQTMRSDAQVNALLEQMHAREYEGLTETADQDAFEDRISTLPVVQAYRQSEQAVRELFSMVDQVISQAAGVPFAENAQSNTFG